MRKDRTGKSELGISFENEILMNACRRFFFHNITYTSEISDSESFADFAGLIIARLLKVSARIIMNSLLDRTLESS